MDEKFEMAIRSYAEAISIIKLHQWQYEVTMDRLKNNRNSSFTTVIVIV